MSIENIGTSPAAANTDTESVHGALGPAPLGTAQQTGANAETATSAPGGSLLDVLLGTGSSETGLPGSEYAASQPDTEAVYGGATLPGNFAPVLGQGGGQGLIGTAADPGVFDTTIGGGAVFINGTPPAYRAPSAYVAGSVRDTTLTDLLGNQINAGPLVNQAAYAATNIDTSYSGGPSVPAPLLSQTDTIPAIASATPYYASQLGIMPATLVVSSLGQVTAITDSLVLTGTGTVALTKTGVVTAPAAIAVTDFTLGHALVLGTDYTLAASGSGPTLTYSVTRIATANSTSGDTWHVSYSYGSAHYFAPAVAALTTDYTVTTSGNGPSAAAFITRAGGSTVLAAGDAVTMAYSYGDASYYDSNFPAPQSLPVTDTLYLSSSPVALNQQGISTAASALAVVDVTSGHTLTYNTDYTVQATYLASTKGSVAANLLGYTITRMITSPNSSDGDIIQVTYAYLASVPGAPGMGALVAQSDVIALSHSVAAPLSKNGIVTTAANLVVFDATTGKLLALTTDYTVAVTGTGATQTYSVTRSNSSANSSDGDSATVAYQYGNAFYFTSGPVVAGNRGVTVTWTPPPGVTEVDYYLVQSSDSGTQYVPATGEPVLYGQPSPSGGGGTGEPTFQSDVITLSHSSPAALSQAGILTPDGQLIVRDTVSGLVLYETIDYTVTTIGAGPWKTYTITRVATSQNSADGDAATVDYRWSSPASVSTFFTQGLAENAAVIYNPNGTVRSFQGYQFQVAAGNRAGLGPFSAWSDFAIPLNPSAYHGFLPSGAGNSNSFDPANAVNPVYRPDGTVKAGTGLGG